MQASLCDHNSIPIVRQAVAKKCTIKVQKQQKKLAKPFANGRPGYTTQSQVSSA